MSRILLLAAALATQSAFAIFGIETDPDKIEAQWVKEKLEAVANDRDPKERAAAAEWLGGRNSPDAIAALAKALSDRDAKVRQAAAGALWKSEKAAEPARRQLLAALEDSDPNVVVQAAGALQAIGMKEEALAAARKRVFDSPEASLSSRFLVSRNLIGREPATKLLEPMVAYLERAATPKVSSHNVELAQQALARLAKTQDRSLLPPLMEAARAAKAGQVVLLKTLALFEPKPEGYTAFVLGFLDSADLKVRYAALGSLRSMTKEKDVAVWAPRAAAMLRDPDSSVRSEALWALGSGAGLAALRDRRGRERARRLRCERETQRRARDRRDGREEPGGRGGREGARGRGEPRRVDHGDGEGPRRGCAFRSEERAGEARCRRRARRGSARCDRGRGAFIGGLGNRRHGGASRTQGHLRGILFFAPFRKWTWSSCARSSMRACRLRRRSSRWARRFA